MKCPNCKLENPDSEIRCDCGYDFQTGEIKKPYLHFNTPQQNTNDLEKKDKTDIINGLALTGAINNIIMIFIHYFGCKIAIYLCKEYYSVTFGFIQYVVFMGIFVILVLMTILRMFNLYDYKYDNKKLKLLAVYSITLVFLFLPIKDI